MHARRLSPSITGLPRSGLLSPLTTYTSSCTSRLPLFNLAVNRPDTGRACESGPRSVRLDGRSGGRPTLSCVRSETTVTSAPVSMQNVMGSPLNSRVTVQGLLSGDPYSSTAPIKA